MSATTLDKFLGGRVLACQPASGYRAGADPVFLAAAVLARAGEHVLELGCGAGVAMLCLKARVPGALVTGVERAAEAAALARANLARNGFAGEVAEADLADLPAELRARRFDHVMANPPFFDRRDGSPAGGAGRETGRGLETPLALWADVALRRLAPGGTFTLVNRIERLPDCLAALDARAGGAILRPLAPRPGQPAKLFVLQVKKGAKGAFRMAPPLILHGGEGHAEDGGGYTAEADAILRHAAPLALAV